MGQLGESWVYESYIRRKSIAGLYVAILIASSLMITSDSASAATATTETSWTGFLPSADDTSIRPVNQTLVNSGSDSIADLGLVANIDFIQPPAYTDTFYEVKINTLASASTRKVFGYSALYDSLSIPSSLANSQSVGNNGGVQISTGSARCCFYGMWYNNMYVSSNGFVVMTNGFPSTVPSEWNTPPTTLPSTSSPNSILAPFARDLDGGTLKWGTAYGYGGYVYFWIVWYQMPNQVDHVLQTFALGFPVSTYNLPICFVYGSITTGVTTIIGYENQEGDRGQMLTKSSSFNAIRLDTIDPNKCWLKRMYVEAVKGENSPTYNDAQSTIIMEGFDDTYPGGINVEGYTEGPTDDGDSALEWIMPSVDIGLGLVSFVPAVAAVPYLPEVLILYGLATSANDLLTALSPANPDTWDCSAEKTEPKAYADHKTRDDLLGVSQYAVWDATIGPTFRWRIWTDVDDPLQDDHILTIKAVATYVDEYNVEHPVTTQVDLKLKSPYNYGVSEATDWFGRTDPDCHDYTFYPIFIENYGYGCHIDSAGSSDSNYDMIGWDTSSTYTVNSDGQLKVTGIFRQTGYTSGCYLRAYALAVDDLTNVLGSVQVLSSTDGTAWVQKTVDISGLPVGASVRLGVGRPDTLVTDYSLGAEWVWVTASAITVVSPNGGEIWYRGTTQTITWINENDPGSLVNIILYHGSTPYTTIASAAPNYGWYSWTIGTSLTLASDYRVEVDSQSVPYVTDFTDGYFTLADATPSITVTSPNGGEGWQMGTTHSITWTYANDPGSYVKIELYKSSTLSRTIISSTACSSGSYQWTVPTDLTASSDYRVKITSTTLTSVYDYSNTYFVILEAPSPPDAPYDLYAQYTDYYGYPLVSVFWNYDDPSVTFNIYRALKSKTLVYVCIAENYEDMMYYDTSIVKGKTYYYYVTAVNAYGESLPSNVDSVTCR